MALSASSTLQSQIIQLTRPAAGETATIAASADAALKMNFANDAATTEASGKDLVFVFPDGGRIVVTGFFDKGADALPNLEMADGTALSGRDFLTLVNPELLSTAAGPAAGPGNPSGGQGEYADDAGNLINGVDRLGALGTDFWGGATEVTENYRGPELPGGTFDASVQTDGGFGSGNMFGASGIYEDWKPTQNVDNPAAEHPAQVIFNFQPTGTTYVDWVDLSGFTAGTEIRVGSPDGSERIITIADPSQVERFSYDELTGEGRGVFVYPPKNDDSDMDITTAVRLVAQSSGIGQTIDGGFTIIVDAAADLPVLGVEYGSDGFIELADTNADISYQKHTENKPGTTNADGEAKSVSIDVSAKFTDVLDGSEHHYFEVRGLPSDWQLTTDLDAMGWQIAGYQYYDENGDLRTDAFGPGEHGTYTLIIEVTDAATNEALANGQDFAVIGGTLKFNPNDWTSSGTGLDENGDTTNGAGVGRWSDGTLNSTGEANIVVAAVAEETPGDNELSLANNRAEAVAEPIVVDLTEDTPDFHCSVKIISDETPWVQRGTDEVWLPHKAVFGIVAGIDELHGKLPVSIATDTVRYDLHSDGNNDSGENAGQANLTLAILGDSATSWKTTEGDVIRLYQLDDGSIAGRVGGADGPIAFLVTLTGASFQNGNNDADITFIQYMSLQHPKGGLSYDELLNKDLKLGLVLTDDDGDKTTTTFTINVHDDGPTLSCDNINVNLAEADLPHGTDPLHIIDNVPGNIHNETFFAGFIGFTYGADGPADPNGYAGVQPFTWNINNLNGQHIQTYAADGSGVDLEWKLTDNGLTVTGYGPDGAVVMTVKATLVPGGATYTVDIDGPLVHPAPVNVDSDRNVLDLKLGFTITDGDKDTALGKLTLHVQDDVPFAGRADINDIVFEKDLRDGGAINTHGLLTAVFGADGPNDKSPIFWDQAAVIDELNDYSVIINGESIPITDSMISFSPDGRTFTVTVDGKEAISGTLTFNEATGKCGYSYTQTEPLAHGDSGIADVALKLDLTYTIMDRDGDKSSNELDITVIDSRALAGYGYAHFDETDARNPDNGPLGDRGFNSPLTGEFDLKLDYDAPDGIVNVTWNKALIDKSLGVYNDAAPAEADGFACRVENDGHLLIISQEGVDVLHLTLSDADGNGVWSVDYSQIAQIDHPLGQQVFGLSHDEPIPFVLPINVIDGDGDSTLNTVAISVDDDGPDPAVGSNVVILQAMGDAILSGLDDLDLSNPQAFIDSLGKTFMDGLTVGLADGTVDLIDLILNTNLSRNAPGELPIFGKDSDRTEKVGQQYEASLQNLEFGADGPADANPVAWGKDGVTALLKLIGLHATGHGGEELTVTGEGQHLQVFSGGVLTLTLDINDQGVATITQNAPLGHNGNMLSGLLSGLVDQLATGELGNLLDTLTGLGISLEELVGALDGGNLLLLPLPVVITDNDGDSAPGLISVVIRDSVPTLTGVTGLTVAEADLNNADHVGTDLGHKVDNDNDGVKTDDEHKAGGQFTYNLGFDGGTATINGEAIVEGAKITGEYGTLIVTGVTTNANGNVVVKYEYELTEAAQHKDGQGTNPELAAGQPQEKFAIVITDGDGDIKTADLNVTIIDDVPQVFSEWDVAEYATGRTFAEGNIFTETSVTTQNGDPVAGKDAFGADGPAAYKPETGALVDSPLMVEGKPVAATGETEVQGQYGTLFITADGSYHYEVDPAKLAAATPEQKPAVGDFDARISLAGVDPTAVTGMAFKAYQGSLNINVLTPAATLAALTQGIGTDTAVKTPNGMGVQGSVSTGLFGLNEGDAIGGTLVSAREGLLITLNEAVADVKLTFNGLGSVEQAFVYAFDAAGNTLGCYPVVGASSWEFPDSTLAGIKSIMIVAGSLSTFTIASITTAPIVMVPAPIEEVFDYTLTDADGDSVNAALTITVEKPEATFSEALLVTDETGMPGMPGGTGAETEASHQGAAWKNTDSGTISNLTGEELSALTVYAAKTAGGTPEEIPVTNGLKVFSEYGEMTFAVNSTTHDVTYTFTQTKVYDHTPNTTPDQLADGVNHAGVETFGFKVGGIPVGTVGVGFEDDGPIVTSAITLPEAFKLTVDESHTTLGGVRGDGILEATLNADVVKAQFTTNYGADEKGADDVYSLQLTDLAPSTQGVPSGLFAVDPTKPDYQGEQIVLVQNPTTGVISGMTFGGAGTADDKAYFTLTINPADGATKLTLLDNIWHGTPGTVTGTTPNNGTSAADETMQMLLDPTKGSLKLVKTVTDGDSDKASAAIDLGTSGVLQFQDDAPVVSLTAPGITHTLTITNHGKTSADYQNCFGYYIKDAQGNPVDGKILWANTKLTEGQPDGNFQLEGYTADQVGFFLIPNGAVNNRSITDLTEVTFAKDTSGNWQVYVKGSSVALTGDGGSNLLLDNAALNVGGKEHVKDNATLGNQNWEDTANYRSDNDYNDVNISTKWTVNFPQPLITQDADTIGANSDTVTTDVGFGEWFKVTANPGADGYANGTDNAVVKHTLTLNSTDSGLTSGGNAITLVQLTNGDIVGQTTVGGVTTNIFKISINTVDGKVSLTQYEAVDHPGETADGNAYNNSATRVMLGDGLITYTATATVTDGDGDTATDSRHFDVSNAFGFDDDKPVLEFNTANGRSDIDSMGTVNIGESAVLGNLDFSGGADSIASVMVKLDNGTSVAASETSSGSGIWVANLANGATLTMNAITDETTLASGTLAAAAYNINVVITDKDGDAVTDNLTVVLKDPNRAPDPQNDVNSIDEDTSKVTGSLFGNDSDPDGDTFTVTQPGTYQGTYGSVVINANGSYEYTLDPSKAATKTLFADTDPSHGPQVDSFTYSITDEHGLVSQHTAKLDITVNPNMLWGGGNTDDTVTMMGGGNDVAVGDSGGTSSTTTSVTNNYNICFLVDVSGSVSSSEYVTMATAIKQALATLEAKSGIINIGLVFFANGMSQYIERSFDNANDAADLKWLQDQFNNNNRHSVDTGATNYSAAFTETLTWFTKGLPNTHPEYSDHVFFITDGEPNRGGTGVTQYNALQTYMNAGGRGGVTVSALGIGMDSSGKTLLETSFDSDRSVPTVDTFDALAKALQETINNTITTKENVGSDAVHGGDGNDTVFGDALNADKYLLMLDASHKTIQLNGQPHTLVAGDSMLIVKAYMNQLGLADTNDALRKFIDQNAFELGLSESDRGKADTLYGDAGDDILFGQGGNDTLYGGAGNDILLGGSGNDNMYGGQGADAFVFRAGEAASADVIRDFNAAEGDMIIKVGTTSGTIVNESSQALAATHTVEDIVQGSNLNYSGEAGVHNHMLVGTGGNDTITGGAGNDIIYGGAGNDTLNGGAGNDVIFGGAGNDTINGGTGNDLIYGGTGGDIMFGGLGNDIFAWTGADMDGGTDVIKDFTLGGDHLRFDGLFTDTQLSNMDVLLGNGALTIQATGTSDLTLTVNSGGHEQTVLIHVENNTITDQTAFNNDDNAQAILLQQILTNAGG